MPVFAKNDLGVKVWESLYLPCCTPPTGAIDLRFPGQWFQSESGLHQNWMRDYDPTTGRYVQADPLGLVDGASVYGYALQNPGRYVDPTGEFIPAAACAAGAAAAFVGTYLGALGPIVQDALVASKTKRPPDDTCWPIDAEDLFDSAIDNALIGCASVVSFGLSAPALALAALGGALNGLVSTGMDVHAE